MGAMEVHHFGGTVPAANRASSIYFAMPAVAIGGDDVVALVLPVGDIAATVVDLVATGEPTAAGER